MSSLRSLIVLAFLCMPITAMACFPCLTRSSLQQTIKQSDVIALVANDDKSSNVDLNAKPELLELTLLKTFKGSVDTDGVLVRSWYGECAYGVQMKLGGKAIVFLQEARDIENDRFDGTFKLVEDGCSAGQLEVRDNKVRVQEKWISLESFTATYMPK